MNYPRHNEKIKDNNEKQRGTESKYIYKSYKSRINSKYVVVLTEDIIDKLDRNDLNILYRTNLTMNDFIPRGNHEKSKLILSTVFLLLITASTYGRLEKN